MTWALPLDWIAVNSSHQYTQLSSITTLILKVCSLFFKFQLTFDMFQVSNDDFTRLGLKIIDNAVISAPVLRSQSFLNRLEIDLSRRLLDGKQ